MQSEKQERIYKPWRRAPEALYDTTPKAYEPPRRRVRQILKQVPLSRDRTRNWRVRGQHDSQAEDNHHGAPREIPQEMPQEMPQEIPRDTAQDLPQDIPREIPQAHNIWITNVPLTTPNVRLSDINALECLNEYRRNLGLGPSRNLISSGIYNLDLDTAGGGTWIQYWNEKENRVWKQKRKQNHDRQRLATGDPNHGYARPVENLRYQDRSVFFPGFIPGLFSPVGTHSASNVLSGLRRNSDVLNGPTPRTPSNEFGNIGSPVPSSYQSLSDHGDRGDMSPVSCLPRRCCISNAIEMLERGSRVEGEPQ